VGQVHDLSASSRRYGAAVLIVPVGSARRFPVLPPRCVARPGSHRRCHRSGRRAAV